MRRRDFIKGIAGSGVFGWPLLASGQQLASLESQARYRTLKLAADKAKAARTFGGL